ncbi:hypothetical protein IDSA_04830 [Pseudidiomarina salinarum]|uniref:Uncharacterized protein n=1 Tax=Pseudidiomarina salinarum TaxID=435908 RepID=A0A094J1R4_9GAMM|nr:hypothetical protein [Pseudidiomarina salinarum]KFZ32004.1 hypothetical protein IDSA_04830 [Pseudidiomarina salinarum]RUO70219.1 hypothetical protein CWI79_01750 [Pseudidiomarina salinarum]
MSKIKLALLGSFAVFFAAVLTNNMAIAQEAQHAGSINIYESQIRNPEELQVYMDVTPRKENPLMKLSEAGRHTFIKGLIWTGEGVGSLNTYPLQIELSTPQAKNVLTLFGLQDLTSTIMKDNSNNGVSANAADDTVAPMLHHCLVLENYRCQLPASCRASFTDICMACLCGAQQTE